MEETEGIPEFIREGEAGRLPLAGVLVMGLLGLLGIGLVVFTAFAFRDERESVAVAETVQAFVTPVPTEVAVLQQPPAQVVVAELPSETPTASETPEATPTETESPTPEEQTENEAETPTATASATSSSEARPTRTYTPGGSPTPTAPATPPVSTPAPKIGGKHGVTGTLALCDPGKPFYATNIEAICVIEVITNHTAANIQYGWLGVHYINQQTGATGDHQSWAGDLMLTANCSGPAGTCGGAHRDEGLRISTPGTYVLRMDMCFSDLNACQDGDGEWETLTPGITVTVVDWTPSP